MILIEARKMFSLALGLLEANLRIRDFPQEKAFYGGLLAKFGDVLREAGEAGFGLRCIDRGCKSCTHSAIVDS
jgi:hypothetical protein